MRATLASTVFCLLAATAGAADDAQCDPGRVDLRGDWGQAGFTVEVAQDEASRAQGLMNVPALAEDAGMLFVYPAPQHAYFWMRNTLIPLDMIFADSEGRITRVHEMAKPLDETLIDGGEGVQYVLEVNGGIAAQTGVSEGDEIRHPSIAEPLWPCFEK